ncbi:MAG TPA: 3-oxoacyl-[acyl-carrier-protein] reductase [Candidatus Kapabacteria bacterium]|jgi:3-oxoacyl-[acyl-carrier protein] reductase
MSAFVGIGEKRVAIVTGGSRGIGRAIVEQLFQQGYSVAAASNDPAGQEMAEELTKKSMTPGKLKVQHAIIDVRDAVVTQAYIDGVIAEHGRIDLLVNNAGVTKDGLLMRMSEADWDFVLDINLKGVFNMTKGVLRTMMSQKSGKIINVASVVGITGNAGQANYAASKAGVIGFTKSIAKEVASRNITVNAIAPGFIETDMTAKLNDAQREAMLVNIPLKRAGKPADIANVVGFLASPASDYITGQVIAIDGGMVM